MAYLQDPLLFSITRNSERDAQFQWVGSLAEKHSILYGKTDSKLNIKSLDDASRYHIDVQNNGITVQQLTREVFPKLKRVNTSKKN